MKVYQVGTGEYKMRFALIDGRVKLDTLGMGWRGLKEIVIANTVPDVFRAIADCMEQKDDSPYLVKEQAS